MRALVTGANGFVGSHVVDELLARGYDVRCLVRPTSVLRWLRRDRLEIAYGDVTEPRGLREALSGADVVLHVAGITKALSQVEFDRTNAAGTLHLLEAAAHAPTPPRVVFVSSIAARGPGQDEEPRAEEEALRPVSRYGRSKATAESHCRAFAREVPIVIVRPPIVYGPRDTDVLELFKMAARGVVLQAGRRPWRYSIVHAGDLARGLVDAAERGRTLTEGGGGEGVYAIADDGPYLWRELAAAAAAGLGRTARVVPVPTLVSSLAGYAGEVLGRARRRPMVVNADKARDGAAGHWTCSSAAARRDLGFVPRLPLAAGFHDTAEWYRAQRWL